MTRHSGGETINQGGAGKPDRSEPDRLDGIVGNVAERGGKPSPASRDRRETGGAGDGAAADAGAARDRAG